MKIKHGLCRRKNPHPLYRCWEAMRRRCYVKSDHAYSSYGGRGISVCERWRENFANFLADMGERPSLKHSLDRIDNNGNYEKSNCRWATFSEQCRNRRNNQLVETQYGILPLTIATQRYNIHNSTIYRIVKNKKISMQDAFQEVILMKGAW